MNIKRLTEFLLATEDHYSLFIETTDGKLVGVKDCYTIKASSMCCFVIKMGKDK